MYEQHGQKSTGVMSQFLKLTSREIRNPPSATICARRLPWGRPSLEDHPLVAVMAIPPHTHVNHRLRRGTLPIHSVSSHSLGGVGAPTQAWVPACPQAESFPPPLSEDSLDHSFPRLAISNHHCGFPLDASEAVLKELIPSFHLDLSAYFTDFRATIAANPH